jgi:hypothetical protein
MRTRSFTGQLGGMHATFVKPSAETTRHKCPYCGALVLIDLANKNIHHEVPACQEYLDRVGTLGGDPSYIGVIDAQDMPKEPSK